jgi:hypothetical protein
MVDVSLVTSLYRAEAHLPGYMQRLRQLLGAVKAAGISVEVILVPNDPSDSEQTLLQTLPTDMAEFHVETVALESVYTSWSRGVELAHGRVIGFLNADDTRTADGIIDAVRLIDSGCQWVYFPYEVEWTGGKRVRRAVARQIPFDRQAHLIEMKAGPFFMFTPALYQKVGRFDGRFRISGDWDWIVRALQIADPCASEALGGTFQLHGGNLSGIGNPRQAVEDNMIRLRHGMLDALTPAPPDLMRSMWVTFAPDSPLLADELAERLFAPEAQAQFDAWLAERSERERARRRSDALRSVPRWLIDRLNLRGLLARLGVVHAKA